MTPLRRAKEIIIWLYWHPIAFVIGLTPAPIMYLGARFCARIAFYLARTKRSAYIRELRNIRCARPRRPPAEERRIVLHTFHNLLCKEFEVFKYPKLNPANIDRYITMEGRENLDAALTQGKGAILLFAHYGANQMIMPAIGHRGYTMCQLSAPPTVWPSKMPYRKFSPMERKALEWRWAFEEALPVTHVNIFGLLKPAFSCLKYNHVLGVAADGGGGDRRVKVELLGRRAQFSIGALQIGVRTGCVVLPVFVERERNGRNRMLIQSPLQIPETDDAGEKVRLGTQAFAVELERFVSRHPWYYLDFMALRAMMAGINDPPLFLNGP